MNWAARSDGSLICGRYRIIRDISAEPTAFFAYTERRLLLATTSIESAKSRCQEDALTDDRLLAMLDPTEAA